MCRARCFEKEKKKRPSWVLSRKQSNMYLSQPFQRSFFYSVDSHLKKKEAYLSNFVQPSTQLNWNGKDYDKVYFSPPPYNLWINAEVQSSKNVARKAGSSPGQVRILEAEGVKKKKNVKSIMDNDAATSWSIDGVLFLLHFMFKYRWVEVQGQKQLAWYTFRALCH